MPSHYLRYNGRGIQCAHNVQTYHADTLKFRHGAQGHLDGASKAILENEFETSNEDECIIKILENGEVQQTRVRNHSKPQGDNFPKLTSWFLGPRTRWRSQHFQRTYGCTWSKLLVSTPIRPGETRTRKLETICSQKTLERGHSTVCGMDVMAGTWS